MTPSNRNPQDDLTRIRTFSKIEDVIDTTVVSTGTCSIVIVMATLAFPATAVMVEENTTVVPTMTKQHFG